MKKLTLAISAVILSSQVAADQLFLDDVIVDGSLCTGQDCVNGENFGFDTIILKENNLRVFFNDTSSSASFPSNDWRITINDSANGGSSYFSIDDATAGRQVFRVDAGAPSNALRVDAQGDVGIGEDQPVVELHITDGDSPTIRLEQDGSSGFTPQTWDVAGNETNFFVRDVTNGSKLPFKIRPGADHNTLYLNNNSNVGVRTASPDAELHVIGKLLLDQADAGAPSATQSIVIRRTDGTAGIAIEETGTGAANLLDLTNAGAARIRLTNSSAPTTQTWVINSNDTFRIASTAAATPQMVLEENGNLTVTGVLTGSSDVNAKENFAELDGAEVLDKLSALQVSTWNFKQSGDNDRHIGPMAQDFYANFQFGTKDTVIAPLDVASVALVGIKQLDSELKGTETQVRDLKQELSEKDAKIKQLEDRLATIESLMTRVN